MRARSACWPRARPHARLASGLHLALPAARRPKKMQPATKNSRHTRAAKRPPPPGWPFVHVHGPAQLEVGTHADLLCLCVRVPLHVQSNFARGLAKMAASCAQSSSARPSAAARCAHAPAAASVPRDHPRSLGARRRLARRAAVVHTVVGRVPPCCSLDGPLTALPMRADRFMVASRRVGRALQRQR